MGLRTAPVRQPHDASDSTDERMPRWQRSPAHEASRSKGAYDDGEPASEEAQLSIKGIFKRFGRLNEPVLKSVELQVGKGELAALLGPSGCGKTTLLRIIAGFEKPDEGRIAIRGRDMTSVPAHRRQVGMVHQQFALWPHMTVAENVAFGLEMRGVARRDRLRRVSDVLELVGLSGFERRAPKSLSGGQQQRVALARALVIEPDLLLLDEPLSALDANRRQQLQRHLRHIQHELGVTTIIVTHDREEAMGLANHLVAMRSGHILQTGSASRLYQEPASAFVMQFTGDANLLKARCVRASSAGLLVDGPLGQIECAAPVARPAPGDAVTLGIRPEDVELRDGSGRDGSGPVGRVTDVVFLGAVTAIDVEVGEDVMTARFESPRAPDLRVGDSVVISVNPDRVRAFEREDQL